jgi:hypothetical protein
LALLSQKAEVMMSRIWNVLKIIRPEGDHSKVAQGLADSLYAQGRNQYAQEVRLAGLSGFSHPSLPAHSRSLLISLAL